MKNDIQVEFVRKYGELCGVIRSNTKDYDSFKKCMDKIIEVMESYVGESMCIKFND